MTGIRSVLDRLRVDPYILAILGTVLIASFLPARGAAAPVFSHLTQVAVGLLFFLYGARLSPRDALDGARHWRLHLLILAATFGLFPLLGVLSRLVLPSLLGSPLADGVLFLTLLPSTVQSSIAFTSMARGNVAAAICSASFSNMLGVLVTPVLVGVLIGGRGGGLDGHALVDIALQLLVPFVAGQLLRPLIGGLVRRHRLLTSVVDRGSILLVVYTAFSEGVVAGIWHQVSVPSLLGVELVCLVLLGVVLVATFVGAGRLGFGRADRITIVFCGSKKSLASGLPMATVLFAGGSVGLLVLPLMLFHQTQLIVCAALARRWARDPEPARAPRNQVASAGG